MVCIERLFQIPILLAVALILVNCGGQSAPTAFFMLSPSAESPLTAIEPDRFSVLVGPVVIADYLDRDQLVTLQSDYRVNIHDLNQWAEPPADNIKRVLIENLSVLLDTSFVYDADSQSSEVADFHILIDINRFHATAKGSAVMIAFWSLHDKDGVIVHRKKSVLKAEAVHSTLAGQVALLNHIIAGFSNEIAETIVLVSKSD